MFPRFLLRWEPEGTSRGRVLSSREPRPEAGDASAVDSEWPRSLRSVRERCQEGFDTDSLGFRYETFMRSDLGLVVPFFAVVSRSVSLRSGVRPPAGELCDCPL